MRVYYTGPLITFLLAFFDLIDEKMRFDAATKTKGSAGPSGMDAELYRRILCSKNFKAEDKALIERGDSRFHKKSVKDHLPSIFAGSLYLLWTHPLGQKP